MQDGEALALAHGAATVVNAMATKKGAAFGVDLYTKAQVKLTGEAQVIETEIISDQEENPVLIQKTITAVLKRFNLEKEYGAKVKTWSNIPIARGLKSSSVAANAVVLATLGALEKSLDDLEVVKLGVLAAFEAKVTITGAFDDACASYFGGLLITDNLNCKLVKREVIADNYVVLFQVPPKKVYTVNADTSNFSLFMPQIEVAYNLALNGCPWEALTLNGQCYSSAFGFDANVAIDALKAGAKAAGLCGKGPTTTAIVSKDYVAQVRAAWQVYEGEIIQACLNHEKARLLT
ncbi:MAG: shikimate kinase [Candidatus Bathyarchaeota archaeon]|uniref:shikimate kinase n=1 Tax=Candidatus Bathycorpusculum sp. TaxID=2994959 RepID=UPI00281A908A|nr:shikimate kinase [Candidatus Termiticorpusculum sp.]MCL2256751.1 shikimate kinase [Candidatus Termiticorpusculum sp.]MCL2293054.1 shikimate kinase [Candidatus Termiticorpusculum sp.]